jgi:hypothetical protein
MALHGADGRLRTRLSSVTVGALAPVQAHQQMARKDRGKTPRMANCIQVCGYPMSLWLKPSTTPIPIRSQPTSMVAGYGILLQLLSPHACSVPQRQFVCLICEDARWAFHGRLGRVAQSRHFCCPRV